MDGVPPGLIRLFECYCSLIPAQLRELMGPSHDRLVEAGKLVSTEGDIPENTEEINGRYILGLLSGFILLIALSM